MTVTVICVTDLWHHMDSLYYIQNKKKKKEKEKRIKKNLNNKRKVEKEQVYHPWIWQVLEVTLYFFEGFLEVAVEKLVATKIL